LTEDAGVHVKQRHGPFAVGPIDDDLVLAQVHYELIGVDFIVENKFKDV